MKLENLQEVLRAAVLVVEYRDGDISTEDGCVATTDIDSIIQLESALCEALESKSDDAEILELGPKIAALKDLEAEKTKAAKRVGPIFLRMVCEQDYESQPDKIDAVNLLFDDLNTVVGNAIEETLQPPKESGDE